MTLDEIARTAKPNQRFRNGTDDNVCFFNEYGVLCFTDMDDEETGFVVLREEILSKDWHYEA